jgi:phospholipase C
VLDHTSILRYLTDKFGLGPLGNRTASAASIADAIGPNPNSDTPTQVGMQAHPEMMTAVTDDAPADYNRNQAALIEFSKQLEVEMGAAPADVGLRAIRAAASPQAEIEAAKERTWLFIEQK